MLDVHAIEYLVNKNLTISCAESVTSGLLQNELASQDGSSRYYLGGATVYHKDMKHKLLGLNYNILNINDCVTQEVADQMAKSVSELYKTDFGLSTSGFASLIDTLSMVKIEPSLKDIKTNIMCAYYCIYQKDKGVLQNGFINCPEAKLKRNEARKYFTEFVFEKLNLLLSNH